MERFDVEITRTADGMPMFFPSGATVTPVRFGWSAIGGPRDAEIEITGRASTLYTVLSWPGQSVVIRNRYGMACWWGYIEEATVSLGQVELGVSLATMYNRISVAYTYQDETGAAQRGTTDWLADAASVAAYGPKELLYSRSNLDNAAAADDLAATLLARFKSPAATVSSGSGARDTARLICRGWWNTVGWKYYAQDMGRENNERTGGSEQVLGVGLSDANGHVVFENGSKRVYQVGGQHGFKAGDKVQITGCTANSGQNNGAKTITGATRKDVINYSATTISFAATDHIRDTAHGFDDFERNDIIQVRGSLVGNSGMMQIDTVEEEGVSTGVNYDHIETADRVIITEAAGNTIILNRYGYLTLKEYVTQEQPGINLVLTAWGKWIGQSFSLELDLDDWTISEVKLRLRKVGTPADGVTLRIVADGGGTPGPTTLDEATVTAANIDDAYTWVTFTLTDAVTPAFGTTYWLFLFRTGLNDPDNYYEFAVEEEFLYARGDLLLYTGATWQARPTDASLAFQILGKQDTGVMIKRIIDETATYINNAGAVSTGVRQYRYREGDSTAADEIERLLDLGNSSQARVLVDVSAQRNASVYIQPAYDPVGEVYRLGADGLLTDRWARPLPPGIPVAAKWIELDDVGLPENLARSYVFFAEGAEYSAGDGTWRLEPQNSPTPFEIGRMIQG